jgi:hypothetical protein
MNTLEPKGNLFLPSSTLAKQLHQAEKKELKKLEEITKKGEKNPETIKKITELLNELVLNKADDEREAKQEKGWLPKVSKFFRDVQNKIFNRISSKDTEKSINYFQQYFNKVETTAVAPSNCVRPEIPREN